MLFMSEVAYFPKSCQRSADARVVVVVVFDVVVVVAVFVMLPPLASSLDASTLSSVSPPKWSHRWCTLAFGNLEAK